MQEVNGPVSFGMGAILEIITLSMLEDVGVRRVSTGGGLTRATFGLLKKAAESMATDGTFTYLKNALSETQVNRVLDGDDDFSVDTFDSN